MLTKILITILIIVSAVVFIRYKKSLEQQATLGKTTHTITIQQEPESSSQANIKYIAIGVLSLSLLTGTLMLFLNWQEEHRLYDIKIINPQTGDVDHYQAYKKDLRGRTFTTITGQQVTVSDLERLEFQEVE